MIPPKLKPGDNIRVIAPSHSLPSDFTDEMKQQAVKGFEKLGLTVSFGKYIHELDDFDTTSVEKRLEDLHDAYADPSIQAITPARGGSSVNQLLKHIDYELIKKNPKVLCGLSDITALSYALYKKTGITNYYGPHFTMLGATKSELVEYSFQAIKDILFAEDPVRLHPSEHYLDSAWDKEVIVNQGFFTINAGSAEGKTIGGNFLTTNLVMGSEYMPDIAGCILFMEENYIMDYKDVQNELQSILNQPGGDKIKGLILERFQKETSMSRELLTKIIKSKKELEGVPVIANVDFGHISPIITIPIGGEVRLDAKEGDEVSIEIIKH